MSKELSNLEEVAEDIFRVKLSTDLIQCTVSGFTLFGWCQTIGKPVKMVVSSDCSRSRPRRGISGFCSSSIST